MNSTLGIIKITLLAVNVIYAKREKGYLRTEFVYRDALKVIGRELEFPIVLL